MKYDKFQWYFIALVLLVYALLMLFLPLKGSQALETSKEIMIKIAPFLIISLVFMILIDYFISSDKFTKNFGRDSGVKGLILAMFAGLLADGPTEPLYPMLGALMKEEVRPGLIATFLYAKAISLPLLPILVLYFGIEYTLVLTGVMIIASAVIGILIEIPVKLSHSFYRQ